MRRFARPYAEVLYEAARAAGAEDAVTDELRAFADAIEASGELRRLAEDPTIPVADKDRVLDALAATVPAGDLVRRFLHLLAGNERLHELRAVHEAYQEIVDARRGVAFAEIRVASPLSSEMRARLEAALGHATGQSLRTAVTVDPTLRCGFVAKVGSRVFDGSLDGEIRRVQALLAGQRPRETGGPGGAPATG